MILVAGAIVGIFTGSRAVRLAGAHGFIREMPQGYHTPLGERGPDRSRR